MDRSEVRGPDRWLSHSVDIALHGDLAVGFLLDRSSPRSGPISCLRTRQGDGRPTLAAFRLEGLIYSRRRNAEPSLLDNLRTRLATPRQHAKAARETPTLLPLR